MALYTHANKKKAAPKFTDLFENKYRHEHVMITNICIVSHILYDRHLYESILCAFSACLKEVWGCTPPPCGMHCHSSTSWCSKAAGKGYNHVSAGLEYPKGGRSEMDRDPEGQSRGYDMTSLQTVPCHIASMLEMSC